MNGMTFDYESMRDWQDCAADGNGCEVSGVRYDDGTPMIAPCPDHKPEHVISVTFKQGVIGGGGPTVYTVALWDEEGEKLSGSTEVTYPGDVPHVPGGEHWFPEAIVTREIREAAEELLRRTRHKGA